MMTGAGARVEHFALDRAERHQLLDHRLRAADVPRRGEREPVHRALVAIHLFESVGINRSGHLFLVSTQLRWPATAEDRRRT
jgi:hypothetical protein